LGAFLYTVCEESGGIIDSIVKGKDTKLRMYLIYLVYFKNKCYVNHLLKLKNNKILVINFKSSSLTYRNVYNIFLNRVSGI